LVALAMTSMYFSFARMDMRRCFAIRTARD
jgi:hypothetical protein